MDEMANPFSLYTLCNRKRQRAGLAYPRTCAKCGLFGVCVEDREIKPASTELELVPVLDVSGLGFTQPEIDCENGDC